MQRVLRVAAYIAATMVLAGNVLCLWAFYVAQQPEGNQDVLMVIPAMSILMMFAGFVLGVCVLATLRDTSRARTGVMIAIAAVGVGLFPLLQAIHF